MILNRPSFAPSAAAVCGLLLAGLMTSQFASAQPVPAHLHDGLVSVTSLNDAWNIENNAMLRSTAFAEQAEQEGYASVSSLFRAAAASQRVHIRNLAVAMKKLGHQPQATPEKLVVNSTAENLRAETALHAGYKEKIFPVLMSALKRENFSAAIRSMSDASRTETSLAGYYEEALRHLEASKGSAKTTYYVCSQCGYLTKRADFHVCRVCYHFRDKHHAVS